MITGPSPLSVHHAVIPEAKLGLQDFPSTSSGRWKAVDLLQKPILPTTIFVHTLSFKSRRWIWSRSRQPPRPLLIRRPRPIQPIFSAATLSLLLEHLPSHPGPICSWQQVFTLFSLSSVSTPISTVYLSPVSYNILFLIFFALTSILIIWSRPEQRVK